jgi:Phage terminase large subunit gpA, ATPase domain
LIWPGRLIDQAKSVIASLVTQFRAVMQSIYTVPVSSATLPIPANSAVGLRSMAARYLFLDGIDGYPGDVDGEGDPVNLAMAKTRFVQVP